ncbi:hypothetical protein [Halorarius halobius]|uniref:hypothetical protein n=1 Tax=Halorarius halobius TaxID=2962671 RepID=UPI0020CBBBC6|nr:hypothetical protein [Halorarius halobius]
MRSPGGVSDDDGDIVRQDVGIALSNVAVGAMLAGTVALAVDLWWIGAVASVATAGLAAAADRSRAGLWALYAAGVAVAVGLAWGWWAGATTVGVVPLLLLGVGSGAGVNRLLFGVAWSVPETRRRREAAE